MKKISTLLILLLMCFIAGTHNVDAAKDDFTHTGSSDYSNPANCSTNYPGCWYNSYDMGFRFTIVDSNGNILPGTGSVDYFTTSASNRKNINLFLTNFKKKKAGHYYYKTYKKSKNNTVLTTKRAQLNISYKASDGYSTANVIKTVKNIRDELLGDSNATNAGYSDANLRNYHVVIEPIYLIYNNKNSTYHLGTATEIATYLNKTYLEGLSQDFLFNIASNMYLDKSKISFSWVDPEGYREVSDGKRSIPHRKKKEFITDVANTSKGFGMHIVSLDKVITDVPPTLINCPVTIDIKECDDSTTISEPTNRNCVVNNSVYSYLSDCNLYCSDTITTDFSGIYDTFIGNNKLNAIQSGKYQSIKGNPKITITKSCYQSSSKVDCPNVAESFKIKLNSDYKTNNMLLKVDGKSYTLIGNPSISNNGYSSATITYEYKLDENINKYINIETMKGDTLTEENKNKVIINGTPMIITNKESYGVYNYNLDVSNTVLNKYISSSNALRNFKNTVNDKYNIQNKMTIIYNGKEATSYESKNLNYSCSYTKYNASDGCLCPENICCDSVTCQPVECPCVCESEYGCLNDGKCTPIKPQSNVCDPEKEMCVIYRPISLTDPFPGVDGDGRIPGNNWNRVVKIDGTNYYSVIDYYITHNRGYNDYEIYQAEPLYVIKLDSKTIKAIRAYNDYKDNDYNDFDLECSNGENCISKFLRGKVDHFSINLIDSGTCKNVTPSTFDSCIKRKGA